MFHMDLGLGRVASALSALGLDRPPYVAAQVVGTNGKGSTATFLEAILQAGGARTGLYTSPHFVSPAERILVDARPVPERAWLDAAEAVLRVSGDVSDALRLTYFELLTVMAAWIFREAGCGAAVFEAGLGGAHDATTALRREVTVFTPMGMDHASILGPTFADIARDKAGAVRPGAAAVTASQEPEAMAALTGAAREAGTALYLAGNDPAVQPGGQGGGTPSARPLAVPVFLPNGWERAGAAQELPAALLAGIEPAMRGPHQQENFRLAAAAASLLPGPDRFRLDRTVLEAAAREAFIPGRLQIVPAMDGEPSFVLDGAHNVPGLACLKRALEELSLAPSAMVFACLGDKDVEAMLPIARALTGGPAFVPPVDAPGRSIEPAMLAHGLGGRAQAAPGVAQALDLAAQAAGPGGMVLVCGSLYLLGEVYALRPEWLERKPAR